MGSRKSLLEKLRSNRGSFQRLQNMKVKCPNCGREQSAFTRALCPCRSEPRRISNTKGGYGIQLAVVRPKRCHLCGQEYYQNGSHSCNFLKLGATNKPVPNTKGAYRKRRRVNRRRTYRRKR